MSDVVERLRKAADWPEIYPMSAMELRGAATEITTLREALAAEKAARVEEREACAKVAESCGDTWSGSRCVEQAVQEAAADEKAAEIAASIRARGLA